MSIRCFCFDAIISNENFAFHIVDEVSNKCPVSRSERIEIQGNLWINFFRYSTMNNSIEVRLIIFINPKTIVYSACLLVNSLYLFIHWKSAALFLCLYVFIVFSWLARPTELNKMEKSICQIRNRVWRWLRETSRTP